MKKDIVIAGGVRTPIGVLSGTLSTVKVTELGALVISETVKRNGVAPDSVEMCFMGNVLPSGQGQNTARQAALGAKLPQSVGCATVNKVCGSGMQAVIMAAQSIECGDAQVVVAGGMENMSQSPYLLKNARNGYRLNNGELVDSLVNDGLWDVYSNKHMGELAELCVKKYELTRQQQDDFAVRSFVRARKAAETGAFGREIVPVEIVSKKQTTVVSQDENLAKFNEEKLRALKPVFLKDGSITAGNASSINDGAAAMLVLDAQKAESLKVKPAARIIGYAGASHDPAYFTTAPVEALKKLLQRVGWKASDVDAWEINEAFAAVTMAAEKALSLDPAKVNLFGGAVALGHPIGCSGARVLVTLMNALKESGGKKGVATLCIGGGEALAMAVERI